MKMKKRLRKKKHVGEFAEYGREIIIKLNRNDDSDEFFDAFIVEAIEGNGCYCFGGGTPNRYGMFVTLGRRCENPDAKMKAIIAWIEAQPDVESWTVSEEYDAFYPKFDDVEDDAE
jgi:uncharacterized protein